MKNVLMKNCLPDVESQRVKFISFILKYDQLNKYEQISIIPTLHNRQFNHMCL